MINILFISLPLILSLVGTCFADSNFLLQVIAGNGQNNNNIQGIDGDNGQATSAKLKGPQSVWVDSVGNTYFADRDGSAVRFVDASTGVINTVMGIGSAAYNSVGGVATQVPLYYPWGCQGDTLGAFLYISDTNHVWKYDISAKTVVRYAGYSSPGPGDPVDGAQATNSFFSQIAGIFLANDGILYLVDYSHCHLYKILTNGQIYKVSGNKLRNICGYAGDNGLADSDDVKFGKLLNPFLDAAGNIFIADDGNKRVRKIDVVSGILTTVAGDGTKSTNVVPGGSATGFSIGALGGVTGDNCGNIYISSNDHNVIYQVNTIGNINILIGSVNPLGVVNGAGTYPRISDIWKPVGMWYDTTQNSLYFTEFNGHLVKKTVSSDASTSLPSCFLFPTSLPSALPSGLPTTSPLTLQALPSLIPSSAPSTSSSCFPSVSPTAFPSTSPTDVPSSVPSFTPSVAPSCFPSTAPSVFPSTSPTDIPSSIPSYTPSVAPSCFPSAAPSVFPSTSPTTIPSSTPSKIPTSGPSPSTTFISTAPTRAPTVAPNANDKVIVNGELIISTVNSNPLNNNSLVTVTQTIRNVSGSPETVSITTINLLKKKGRLVVKEETSFTFQIYFLLTYSLSFYPEFNSSYLAHVKSSMIKEAVDEGRFQSVLRTYAVMNSAIQLYNGTVDSVTLSTTTISSSADEDDDTKLSDGAVAGLVIGCIFGSVLIFGCTFVFYRRSGSSKIFSSSKEVDSKV
jgi:hypothetical protein